MIKPDDYWVTKPGRIMSDAEGAFWIGALRGRPAWMFQTRPLFRCRDSLLQRRYEPKPQRSVRTACLWQESGRLRMLIGHASMSKTPIGVLYNRRLRLVARFGLSSFKRRDA